MQMRVLSTSTMAEDGDKHKNNANQVAKQKKTMPNEFAKHKNKANELLSKITMANEVSKQENDGN